MAHIYYTRFLFLTLVLTLCTACRKDEQRTEQLFPHETILNSDTLKYNLGSFGDEEGAWIQLQASNYEISEVARNLNTSEMVYSYKALQSFTGTDSVILRSERGSNGASPNDEIIITTLYIRVE